MDDAQARWEAEYAASGKPHTMPAITLIDPRKLEFKPVPERQWIVQDWLGVGHTTADYGDGGTGKTLLAQQLMTACATGTPWIGLAVKRCRVLGLFCEDDPDELHRRQEQINAAARVGFGDLGDMRWISGAGQDNMLVTFPSDGKMHVTERFSAIEEEAKKFGAGLVVLDTAADLFGGNENDRRQVRQFIGQLTGMALRLNAAVLLNAHPSRAGLGSGENDGGSTAWSNSVRSRWSLARPAADSDQPSDPDARVLTRRKANYARIGDSIQLRWTGGVLVPLVQEGGVFGSINRQAAEEVFMRLLDRSIAQGLNVSHSRNSGNFAPTMFAKRPDAEGYKRKDFDAAMSRLFTDRRIIAETYGRISDTRQRIARAPETAADVADVPESAA